MRVTGYDVVLPLPKLEDFYAPTVERIRKAIDEVLKY
jgi:pyruvate/2-oxoglutarate/acetoin dehydrogenase E1 component